MCIEKDSYLLSVIPPPRYRMTAYMLIRGVPFLYFHVTTCQYITMSLGLNQSISRADLFLIVS